MQFMHSSSIFAMLAVLATSVTHSMGCKWGCCDSICLPPPPLVVPHPLSFPKGGWGTVTWSTENFFVVAHCVAAWVTVLWGTATCIPCTHGGTFYLLSLKWNLTAQPCFPLGQL